MALPVPAPIPVKGPVPDEEGSERMHFSVERRPAVDPDPPLSTDQHCALQRACAPVGSLRFPPPEIIRVLRQYGYIEIVLGGIQITPSGLERLLRDRKRAMSDL